NPAPVLVAPVTIFSGNGGDLVDELLHAVAVDSTVLLVAGPQGNAHEARFQIDPALLDVWRGLVPATSLRMKRQDAQEDEHGRAGHDTKRCHKARSYMRGMEPSRRVAGGCLSDPAVAAAT